MSQDDVLLGYRLPLVDLAERVGGHGCLSHLRRAPLDLVGCKNSVGSARE